MDFSIRGRNEHLVLFSIFLIALSLRLTTAHYDRLLGADPWYHFKIASILLETAKYPMYEYYSRYPFGEPVASPPGLYYLPVFIYKLLGITGISFFKIFQLLPATFGALTVVPLYLLVRELYNKKIGFLAALLLSVSPAGIERSLAGFYRGEVFMLFTMLFAFYFFIRSVREKIYFSIPAALFILLSGLMWSGWPMIFAILTLTFIFCVLANYYQNRNSDSLIISYAVTCGLGLLLLSIFKAGFYRYEDNLKETGIFILGFKLLLLIIISMVILEFMNRSLNKKIIKPWIPIAFLLIALVAAYNGDYFQRALGEYHRSLESVRGIGLTLVYLPTHVWRLGITEQQAVNLEYLVSIYGVLLIIAPVGLLFVLREKLSVSKAFSTSFVAVSAGLLIFQVRFTFLAAPALCLLGALILYHLLMRENWKKHVSIIFVFLLIFANVYAATSFSTSIEPLVSDDLYEALTWINQNTPKDSIILSWWDYTGPIMAVANRRTVTHTAPSGIVESTSLALRTSNETQALEIFRSMNEDFYLKDMKIDYILIDSRMYSLWQKIFMFEPFVNRPVVVENRDLASSILTKLYLKRGVENFELAFENDNVKVYRPLFKDTRIVDLEVKRYYSKGEEVRIGIKTSSNELESIMLAIDVLDSGKNSVFNKEVQIEGTSREDVTFNLPKEYARGTYTITAQLYDLQGNKMHSMMKQFIVIN